MVARCSAASRIARVRATFFADEKASSLTPPLLRAGGDAFRCAGQAGRRKQVSTTRGHHQIAQVLPREESTSGKPSLACPRATLDAKRR